MSQGGGESPSADGQKVAVHKNQKSPFISILLECQWQGGRGQKSRKFADVLNGWSLSTLQHHSLGFSCFEPRSQGFCRNAVPLAIFFSLFQMENIFEVRSKLRFTNVFENLILKAINLITLNALVCISRAVYYAHISHGIPMKK